MACDVSHVAMFGVYIYDFKNPPIHRYIWPQARTKRDASLRPNLEGRNPIRVPWWDQKTVSSAKSRNFKINKRLHFKEKSIPRGVQVWNIFERDWEWFLLDDETCKGLQKPRYLGIEKVNCPFSSFERCCVARSWEIASGASSNIFSAEKSFDTVGKVKTNVKEPFENGEREITAGSSSAFFSAKCSAVKS